jgi:hypothetical protein
MPKHWIAGAIELTAWLHTRQLAFCNLDQALLDRWLVGGSGRADVGQFLKWLAREDLVGELCVPPRPPGTPVIALTDHERLEGLRRLLADETLAPHLRLAGTLVLLYAQPTARIVRLTIAEISLSSLGAEIRFGRDPVPLPAVLTPAIKIILERARQAPGPGWLFPGLKAGQPTHPSHLANRLRALGVPVAAARASAIQALAFRIPAPVLAEVLGLSASTAARASGELKVDYAGYVAHRSKNPNA